MRSPSSPPKEVKEKDGIDLYFVNTANMADPAAELRELTGGTGFDDVFCYAPIAPVVGAVQWLCWVVTAA